MKMTMAKARIVLADECPIALTASELESMVNDLLGGEDLGHLTGALRIAFGEAVEALLAGKTIILREIR